MRGDRAAGAGCLMTEEAGAAVVRHGATGLALASECNGDGGVRRAAQDGCRVP